MYGEHCIDDRRSPVPCRTGVRHDHESRAPGVPPSPLPAGRHRVTAAITAGRAENAIRKLRCEADEMTQAALAETVRVTRQTIIAIEAGRHAPSLELAFRIAAAFGQPLEDVLRYRP